MKIIESGKKDANVTLVDHVTPLADHFTPWYPVNYFLTMLDVQNRTFTNFVFAVHALSPQLSCEDIYGQMKLRADFLFVHLLPLSYDTVMSTPARS